MNSRCNAAAAPHAAATSLNSFAALAIWVRVRDTETSFLSEASVYRILKCYDLVASPAYVVVSVALMQAVAPLCFLPFNTRASTGDSG